MFLLWFNKSHIHSVSFSRSKIMVECSSFAKNNNFSNANLSVVPLKLELLYFSEVTTCQIKVIYTTRDNDFFFFFFYLHRDWSIHFFFNQVHREQGGVFLYISTLTVLRNIVFLKESHHYFTSKKTGIWKFQANCLIQLSMLFIYSSTYLYT